MQEPHNMFESADPHGPMQRFLGVGVRPPSQSHVFVEGGVMCGGGLIENWYRFYSDRSFFGGSTYPSPPFPHLFSSSFCFLILGGAGEGVLGCD